MDTSEKKITVDLLCHQNMQCIKIWNSTGAIYMFIYMTKMQRNKKKTMQQQWNAENHKCIIGAISCSKKCFNTLEVLLSPEYKFRMHSIRLDRIRMPTINKWELREQNVCSLRMNAVSFIMYRCMCIQANK